MRPAGLAIAASAVLLLGFLFVMAMMGGNNPARLDIIGVLWPLVVIGAIGLGGTALILAVRNRLDRHDR